MSPRSFSSVVTYQNNATLFTIDLDPRLDSNQENKNLLANFKGTEDVNYEENIGFACDYNLPIPGNSTHFYTRCFMGNSRGIPQLGNDDIAVKIFDYTWEYPVAEAFTRSNKKYDYVPAIDESFPGEFLRFLLPWKVVCRAKPDVDSDVYGIQPFGTDILLAPLAEDIMAIVWLAAAHKVIASGIEPYHKANTSGLAPEEEPLWSEVFSSDQFGATSPRSTTVYVYYQANATAVGEITYDVERMLWAEESSFLLITWYIYWLCMGWEPNPNEWKLAESCKSIWKAELKNIASGMYMEHLDVYATNKLYIDMYCIWKWNLTYYCVYFVYKALYESMIT